MVFLDRFLKMVYLDRFIKMVIIIILIIYIVPFPKRYSPKALFKQVHKKGAH